MLYMLITDDGIDQICETKATANKEKRDLVKMGCNVKIKQFETWEAANAYEDKYNAKR